MLQYFYEVAITDPVPVGFFPLIFFFLQPWKHGTYQLFCVTESKRLMVSLSAASSLTVSISGLDLLSSYKILYSLIAL